MTGVSNGGEDQQVAWQQGIAWGSVWVVTGRSAFVSLRVNSGRKDMARFSVDQHETERVSASQQEISGSIQVNIISGVNCSLDRTVEVTTGQHGSPV